MKDILEQLNKLIDNYIEVGRLIDRACLLNSELMATKFNVLQNNIETAINFTVKKLTMVGGGNEDN